jgi:hypothetical protein
MRSGSFSHMPLTWSNIGVEVQHEGARGTTAAHLAAELQTDESITTLGILLSISMSAPVIRKQRVRFSMPW